MGGGEASISKQNPRDFIVVTFEHRNHGKRLVDERANLGWSHNPEEHNERQATDLYGMIMGAVKDISFLIDFLPAYLFPNDERTIGEWVLAGFSLGAHVTWLGLRHEPRIRIGIPISGCPDYLALIEQHAERLGIPCVPPYIPASLRALVRAHGTVAAPAGTFVGKRVLVLAGADDKLVPWAASRAFVEALDVGRGGRKEVVLLPGVKHELTDGMREEMFRFFWEEALVGEPTVRRSAL
ncbi:Alpha/Beta hydrolase protein [Russula brevipes]|nr:Alpha/Beta hydrolase protein [Russula brevipes]